MAAVDRNGYAPSILQTERKCYVTGLTGTLVRHEIYFGSGRGELSKPWGGWVWLRPDWRNTPSHGVHMFGGRKLDRRLKQECQRRFEELYSHETFIRTFGRSYL